MPEYPIEGKNLPTTVDWLRSIASLVIEKHIAAVKAASDAPAGDGRADAGDRLRSRWEIVAPRVRVLSQRQRQVVELRFREGMCYADIAARLGIPVGTVRSRLARARTIIEDHAREPAGRAEAGAENAADASPGELVDAGPVVAVDIGLGQPAGDPAVGDA